MTEQESNESQANNGKAQVRGSAFGICLFRSLLSLLPPQAGSLRYDANTPNFEGVALSLNPSPNGPLGPQTLASAQMLAQDLPGFTAKIRDQIGAAKDWHGFDFNVCRAHTVDQVLLESVGGNNGVQQVVFCGVGQDYRGMRHGPKLHKLGVTVFELDLKPMMELREKVKDTILANLADQDWKLPETHALSIDLGNQSVSQVLLACPAFDPTFPTLYLWEGVSYYLTPTAMRSFLTDIVSLMARVPPELRLRNRVFFDYLIDLPTLAATGDLPAKAMLDMFAKMEPLQSFLEFDQVAPYLAECGLSVEQHLVPPDMYQPFQTNADPAFRLTASPYFGMVVAKPVVVVVSAT